MNDKMAQNTDERNKSQVKADKRAAALRENLKKRKALAKNKQEQQNAKIKDSQ